MIYIFQLDLDRVAWDPTTLEVTVVRGDSLYAAVFHYAELLYELIKESEGGDLVRIDPSESENSLTIFCMHKVYKLSIYLIESSLIKNYPTKADIVRIPFSIIELVRHELESIAAFIKNE